MSRLSGISMPLHIILFRDSQADFIELLFAHTISTLIGLRNFSLIILRPSEYREFDQEFTALENENKCRILSNEAFIL